MHLVETRKRVWLLGLHHLGSAAVHQVDEGSFKRVHETLSHAVRLRAAHRRMHGLDAQLACQRVRFRVSFQEVICHHQYVLTN